MREVGRKSSTPNIDLEYDDGGVEDDHPGEVGAELGQLPSTCEVWWTTSRAPRPCCGKAATSKSGPLKGSATAPARVRDLGSRIQLIGNEFWQDISGWRGSAQRVLKVIGHHAGNGLTEVRTDARDRMVSYLQTEGVRHGQGPRSMGPVAGLGDVQRLNARHGSRSTECASPGAMPQDATLERGHPALDPSIRGDALEGKMPSPEATDNCRKRLDQTFPSADPRVRARAGEALLDEDPRAERRDRRPRLGAVEHERIETFAPHQGSGLVPGRTAGPHCLASRTRSRRPTAGLQMKPRTPRASSSRAASQARPKPVSYAPPRLVQVPHRDDDAHDPR